ncbi:lipid A deacylase LpxR family protein [Dongia deserti]|uniref:lipid A deacylase LpxR family protein n=1 Tax=Dongia deserti TaxID=2268030 RepID=UPI0013C52304|nr:lipid A deacylase LpxR family protein [Dongia deserti]
MRAKDQRTPGLCLAVATVAAMLGAAQARADDNSRFGVIEENDSIGFGKDKYYTQGIEFIYLGPDVAADSALMAPFNTLADLGPFDAAGAGEVSRRYEVMLGQSMFTPEDTAREDPDPSDRPYAAWFYGGVGLIQDTDRRRLDHLELLVGVVGPAAFGKKTQNDWHQYIGVDESRGWDKQLDNEPGLVLSYERKWRLLQPIGDGFGVDAIPELGVTVGNVFDYVQAGGMLRFGKNLEADYGPSRIRPALSGTPYFNSDYLDGPFGFYFFIGAQGRAVARNLFLDGNTFEDSRSVDSEALVGDLSGGLSMFWTDAVKLDAVVTYRSEEFERQDDPTKFAGINVTIGF